MHMPRMYITSKSNGHKSKYILIGHENGELYCKVPGTDKRKTFLIKDIFGMARDNIIYLSLNIQIYYIVNREEMTVKELYDWAVEHGVENLPLYYYDEYCVDIMYASKVEVEGDCVTIA